ncbi:MAG: hypothetical protein ACOZBW_08525, partial [Thermodesulfobacteriota bacterium]
RLIAVALINVTDMALNLSELSNCLTVFVTDEAGFTRDIWTVMVERLSRLFHQKRFPVLVNPVSYAENRGITFQKRYILWILSTRYSDHYFEYLDQVDKMAARHHEKETS